MQTLNTALPDFAQLTGAASSNIKSLLSGQLTRGQQNAIQDFRATQAVGGGMPGTAMTGGTLYGNAAVMDAGIQSGKNQQSGLENFLNMLKSFSGTVVPTTGQQIQSSQWGQEFGRQLKQDQRAEAARQEAIRAEQSKMWNSGRGSSGNGLFFNNYGSSYLNPVEGVSTFGNPY